MRPFIEILPIEKRTNGNGFVIDGVSLATIRQQTSFPCYVTSLSAVEQRAQYYVQSMKNAFPKSAVFYALKANYSTPLLKQLISTGCGADIVSIGEWRVARKAGFLPENICYAGVGKKAVEWQEAIEGGVGHINVEHIAELDSILLYMLSRPKLKTRLAIRINPCLDLKTHPHLRTGSLDSKFGILFSQVKQWLLEKQKTQPKEFFTPIFGLHIHIGSQIENPEIQHQAVAQVFSMANELLDLGIAIGHLDFGGGLHVGFEGVPADGSDIKHHISFLKNSATELIATYPRLKSLWGTNFEHLEVCVEPGRSMVASSTVYLTEVLYEKQNSSEHRFCYVDAGMNDFPRPSMYNAKHQLLVADFKTPPKRGFAEHIYQVVGPVCESADFLARNVPLPYLSAGDCLVFFEGGAYCFSMSSHYNLRALPAQVYVKNKRIEVVLPAIEF